MVVAGGRGGGGCWDRRGAARRGGGGGACAWADGGAARVPGSLAATQVSLCAAPPSSPLLSSNASCGSAGTAASADACTAATAAAAVDDDAVSGGEAVAGVAPGDPCVAAGTRGRRGRAVDDGGAGGTEGSPRAGAAARGTVRGLRAADGRLSPCLSPPSGSTMGAGAGFLARVPATSASPGVDDPGSSCRAATAGLRTRGSAMPARSMALAAEA